MSMTEIRPLLRTLLFLLGIGPLGHAFAQQEVMISQYMFNGLLLNPAYAGSHPYASASLLHRAQWVGMDGAPRTSTLAIDGPLADGSLAAGFTLVHDRIGVSRDLEMAGHFAYRMRTGAQGHLAFGLKAGLSVYSARLSELVHWDAQDALYRTDINNVVLGKFGFGAYWSDERSYVGLSLPTLYAAEGAMAERATGNGSFSYFQRHYYLHAGHVFNINESVDLKPSTLVKVENGAPPQVDINLHVLYRERFWLGAGYRSGAALVGMVEYRVSPLLRVGYAYDMTTSLLRDRTSGSHEVMLGFAFGKDPIMVRSPRYF